MTAFLPFLFSLIVKRERHHDQCRETWTPLDSAYLLIAIFLSPWLCGLISLTFSFSPKFEDYIRYVILKLLSTERHSFTLCLWGCQKKGMGYEECLSRHRLKNLIDLQSAFILRLHVRVHTWRLDSSTRNVCYLLSYMCSFKDPRAPVPSGIGTVVGAF